MNLKSLSFTDSIHARAANWTLSLHSWFTIFHSDWLGIRVLSFGAALYTIHTCHKLFTPLQMGQNLAVFSQRFSLYCFCKGVLSIQPLAIIISCYSMRYRTYCLFPYLSVQLNKRVSSKPYFLICLSPN